MTYVKTDGTNGLTCSFSSMFMWNSKTPVANNLENVPVFKLPHIWKKLLSWIQTPRLQNSIFDVLLANVLELWYVCFVFCLRIYTHFLWRATNFELYWALTADEQWGFLNVPQLPRHGPTLYNGHLRGPVTLKPVPSVWQWSCHDLF